MARYGAVECGAVPYGMYSVVHDNTAGTVWHGKVPENIFFSQAASREKWGGGTQFLLRHCMYVQHGTVRYNTQKNCDVTRRDMGQGYDTSVSTSCLI